MPDETSFSLQMETVEIPTMASLSGSTLVGPVTTTVAEPFQANLFETLQLQLFPGDATP